MNLRLRAKYSLTVQLTRNSERVGIKNWDSVMVGLDSGAAKDGNFWAGIVACNRLRPAIVEFQNGVGNHRKRHCGCGCVEGRKVVEWGELVRFFSFVTPCTLKWHCSSWVEWCHFFFFSFSGWKSMLKTASIHLKWNGIVLIINSVISIQNLKLKILEFWFWF